MPPANRTANIVPVRGTLAVLGVEHEEVAGDLAGEDPRRRRVTATGPPIIGLLD